MLAALFLAVCRHACLTLGEVTYCPQLSYCCDRCTRYLFQSTLWTRSPSVLRSCKGWKYTKYKVFNNWEPETQGQTSCKGCRDIFLREGKQKIQKESLGLPSSVLLGDLYLWTSKPAVSVPGWAPVCLQIAMRYSCSSGQEIQRRIPARDLGVLWGTEWWQHLWALGTHGNLQACDCTEQKKDGFTSELLKPPDKRLCKCSSKISRTKHIQFVGTDSNVLSYFHRMYLIMSSQTIKAVRTHARANILTSCTHA